MTRKEQQLLWFQEINATNSPEATNNFIKSIQYWVRACIVKYAAIYRLTQTEIQTAENICLLKLLKKWNPELGQLTTIAYYYSRAAINDVIRERLTGVSQISAKDLTSHEWSKFRHTHDNSPVIACLQHESSMMLQTAISTLPERLQKIIYDRYWRGASHRTISKELGVSRTRVEQLEKNAIRKLKQQLVEEELYVET